LRQASPLPLFLTTISKLPFSLFLNPPPSHLHSCTSVNNHISESGNSSGRKINLGCWNSYVFLVVDTFKRCKTKKWVVVRVHIIKACEWVEV
jgi:hypothetical protein